MRSTTFIGQLVSTSAVALCALAFLLPSTVQADITVCTAGSSPGQCTDPTSVATDTVAKRVYVADRGNHEIDVFEVKEGEGKVEFLFSFPAGSRPRRVAVNNDSLSPAFHDVYVFDSADLKVMQFSPAGVLLDETAPGEFNDSRDVIATGPSGEVYVGDIIDFDKETILKKFDLELEPVAQCVLPHKDGLNQGLAIDTAGNIYGAFNKGGGIYKFGWGEPHCSEAGAPFPITLGIGTAALGLDNSGQIYAVQGIAGVRSSANFRVVTRFSAAGTTLRRFGFGFAATTAPGIAPLATSFGDFFTAEEEDTGKVMYLKEPPAGPLVAALFTPVPVGNVRTTLEAEIDPEGEAGTEYHFEYLTQSSFDNDISELGPGHGFDNATKAPIPDAMLPGPANFELKEHLASAEIGCPDPLAEAKAPGIPGETAIEAGECLQPETDYRYRVIAHNSAGEGNSPVEGTFTTGLFLEVEDAFVSEVSTDIARLSATVNPLGIPTTGYFEYVTEEQFQNSGFDEATQVPNVGGGAGPVSFGAGEDPITRSTLVSLAPATEYRFRFLATDPLLLQPRESQPVAFRTLTPEAVLPCPANEAFRLGSAAFLPDCRAYELVSPLDKEGGDIESASAKGRALSQAAPAGGALAYGSYTAFGDAVSAPITSQYMAAREEGEWVSHSILAPRGRASIAVNEAVDNELRYLSPDLCEAWLRTLAEPPLALKAQPGQLNLYRRTDGRCAEDGLPHYEAITTAKPMHGAFATLELQGVSADGDASVYITRDNLEGTEAPDLDGNQFALYYQHAGEGKPTYVCYGTDGKLIAAGCTASTTSNSYAGYSHNSSLTGALSADGQRVFFSSPLVWPGGGAAKIYLRERPGQKQSNVDGAGKCTQPLRACTIAVSAKGEELQGTSQSQFWAASPDGSLVLYTTGNALYEFEVDTKTTRKIAGGSAGVMGASKDLSRIYFSSTEVLPGAGSNPLGDGALAGQPNIYLEEEGSLRFVGTLAPSDVNSPLVNTAISPRVFGRHSRVSADGSAAIFMSIASLTDYDNTDASSDGANTEVFRYQARGEGEEASLTCVSCNPTGGRPIGTLLNEAVTTNYRAAATIPGWQTSLYPGRVMSEDGERVFFTSYESLVPRDSNGAPDVYQWEEPGSGACSDADRRYSAQNGGCLSLISSGQGAGGAEYLDTDEEGANVFFTTAQSLVPPDYGLVDVYDARVDGGQLYPAPSTPGCEGEACQGPYQPPEDQTPASSTFQGAGNVIEPKAKKKHRKAKRKKTKKSKSKAHRRRAKTNGGVAR